MKSKVLEKEKAIRLRRKGCSYNDILEEVPVAKSTLSSWLKDLPLTRSEKQYLRSRSDASISRGRIKAATANRARRLERDTLLFEEAKTEFEQSVHDPLFQVGVALYWAEGARRNSYFAFSNSDTDMINIMLDWIEKYLSVSRGEINARLYIHKPYAHEQCEKYWSRHTSIPVKNFRRTIYKPTGKLVKKRPQYKGVLRIAITKVIPLKKMLFWQSMLVEHYKKK